MTKYGTLLLLIALLFVVMDNPVYAKEKHVTDCLEAEEDCLDSSNDTPTTVESTDENAMKLTEVKTSSLFLNIVKMVVALLFVLGLIYLLLLFLKKKNKLFQQDGVIENVGGLSIGQQKSIQIIRIGEAMYIIGVGDNVEMLQEITDEQEKQHILEKKDIALQAPSFLQGLWKQNKQESSSSHTDDSFTMKLQDELSKLKRNRNNMKHQAKKKDDEYV